MMQALEHASRRALQEHHLPVAQAAAVSISAKVHKPSANEGRGKGFWDDFCLAHLLEGVCWRLIAYPVSCRFIPVQIVAYSSESARVGSGSASIPGDYTGERKSQVYATSGWSERKVLARTMYSPRVEDRA